MSKAEWSQPESKEVRTHKKVVPLNDEENDMLNQLISRFSTDKMKVKAPSIFRTALRFYFESAPQKGD